MIKFSVPVRLRKTKNKYFNLNFNEYRNAHYRVLANVKRDFAALVPTDRIRQQLLVLPISRPVRLHYTYYPASSQKYDRMNVLAVVDKFLNDALVDTGILKDDNYEWVLTPTFEHGEVDPNNPRCDVWIEVC
jgi:hypothetical protein